MSPPTFKRQTDQRTPAVFALLKSRIDGIHPVFGVNTSRLKLPRINLGKDHCYGVDGSDRCPDIVLNVLPEG